MAKYSPHAWQLIKLLAEGSFEGAEKLLRDKPGILRELNSCGETPLHWLVIENYIEPVRWLLERGDSVESPDHSGTTLLMHAAMLNSVALVRVLLSFGPNVNARSSQGESALDLAARKSADGEMVKLLLDAGALVNECDERGNTALMHAAKECNVAAARQLLKAGADANARTSRGETAVHQLASAIFRETAPGWARSTSKFAEFMTAFQEFGGNPGAVDDSGWTALHKAALSGNAGAVRCLLAFGFDPRAQDHLGLAPQDLALRSNHIKVAELLANDTIGQS